MKWLVDKTLRESPNCAYYFFRATTSNKGAATGASSWNDPATAICAILHQLCAQRYYAVLQLLEESYDDWGEKLSGNLHRLWDILTEAAEGAAEPIICFIDALDEADTSGRDEFMRLVNEHYKRSNGRSKLKMIMSARPYFDTEFKFTRLVQDLRKDVNFEIRDERLSSDVDKVIDFQAQQLPLTLDMQTYLVSRLKQKQNSKSGATAESQTFLWLKLMFDTFRDDLDYHEANEGVIDKLVENAPEDLDSLYEKLLDKNDKPEKRQRTRLLFHLILGAGRAVRLRELQVALHYAEKPDIHHDVLDPNLPEDETFRRKIVALCGTLITTVDNDVFIFHETLKKFLQVHGSDKPSRDQWQHSFHSVDTLILWTKVCGQLLRAYHQNAHRSEQVSWQPLLKWVQDVWYGYTGMVQIRRHSFASFKCWRSQLEMNLANSFTEQYVYDISDECFWLWFWPRCGDIRDMPDDILGLFWSFATPDAKVRGILQLKRKDELQCGICEPPSDKASNGSRICQVRYVLTCQDINRFKRLLYEHTSDEELRRFAHEAKARADLLAAHELGSDEGDTNVVDFGPSELLEHLQKEQWKRARMRREERNENVRRTTEKRKQQRENVGREAGGGERAGAP